MRQQMKQRTIAPEHRPEETATGRTALSTMASNAGCASVGELEIRRRISLVAA
jgi:hypothetical protein